MSALSTRAALAEALSWTSGEMTRYSDTAHPDHNRWSWRGDGHGDKARQDFLDQADALIASGAVVDVDTLADEIAGLFPYNGELRPDGSEDPRAAAYVEGLRDAWQVVKDCGAALTERAS